VTFTEPLNEFFSTDDFAETAVSGATTVYGIFENAYSEDLSSQGTLPIFTCTTTNANLFSVNDILTVSGTNYYLRVKKPDGAGVTVLVLEKVLL
jgi:hypothetical protein